MKKKITIGLLSLMMTLGIFYSPINKKQNIVKAEDTVENENTKTTNLDILNEKITDLSNTLTEYDNLTGQDKFIQKGIINGERNDIKKYIDQYIEERTLKDIDLITDDQLLVENKSELDPLISPLITVCGEKVPFMSYSEYESKVNSLIYAYSVRIAKIQKNKALLGEKTTPTHYENDLFTIDVPDSWASKWTIETTSIGENDDYNVATYSVSSGVGIGEGGAIIKVVRFLYPGTDKLGYGEFQCQSSGSAVGWCKEGVVFIDYEVGAGFFNKSVGEKGTINAATANNPYFNNQ